MSQATHFALGVASYYDPGNDVTAENMLVPVCTNCAAKWSKPVPFSDGLEAYVAQERELWNKPWRDGATALPTKPSVDHCEHKPTPHGRVLDLARDHLSSKPLVQVCELCDGLRGRATADSEFGPWTHAIDFASIPRYGIESQKGDVEAVRGFSERVPGSSV